MEKKVRRGHVTKDTLKIKILPFAIGSQQIGIAFACESNVSHAADTRHARREIFAAFFLLSQYLDKPRYVRRLGNTRAIDTRE